MFPDITERSEMRNIWWLRPSSAQMKHELLSRFSHRCSLALLFSFFVRLVSSVFWWWRNSANWNFWFFLEFSRSRHLHNQVVTRLCSRQNCCEVLLRTVAVLSVTWTINILANLFSGEKLDYQVSLNLYIFTPYSLNQWKLKL